MLPQLRMKSSLNSELPGAVHFPSSFEKASDPGVNSFRGTSSWACVQTKVCFLPPSHSLHPPRLPGPDSCAHHHRLHTLCYGEGAGAVGQGEPGLVATSVASSGNTDNFPNASIWGPNTHCPVQVNNDDVQRSNLRATGWPFPPPLKRAHREEQGDEGGLPGGGGA